MKKEKIWIFDLNKIMIFRAVAWGILTRPQVGDFQVATGAPKILQTTDPMDCV
jgi:hypothetical protein